MERTQMDRPLRLVASNPVDELARTIEALLVVASAPLARATSSRTRPATTPSASPTRSSCSASATAKGAAGSCSSTSRAAAPSAPREAAADACARLFERPVERGLSRAALETLAIVAYLGPCTRPEIARIRGVSADAAVAGPRRARPRRRGRPRPRVRRRPLRDDAALRARLRARVARGAAAGRRRRRRRGADPRAPRGGRRRPSPTLAFLASRWTSPRTTFAAEVIERSAREPVVVDFWAEWCGPCKRLTPVLESAVEGRPVTLAKIDVDANKELARRFDVSGIPAVKAFRNGEVVAEFVGARSRRGRRRVPRRADEAARRGDDRRRGARGGARAPATTSRRSRRCSRAPPIPSSGTTARETMLADLRRARTGAPALDRLPQAARRTALLTDAWLLPARGERPRAAERLARARRRRVAPRRRRADQGRPRDRQRRAGAAEHLRREPRPRRARRPAARAAGARLRPAQQAGRRRDDGARPARAPDRRRARRTTRSGSSRSAASTPTRPARCCSRTTASSPTGSPIRATRSTRSTSPTSRATRRREALAALEEGVELDDGRTAPARARRLGRGRVELVLHEGRKHQVKRMLAAVGHPVRRLHRSRYGPLTVEGLEPGEWRAAHAGRARRAQAGIGVTGPGRSRAP